MKVKVQGFQIGFASNISFSEVFQLLESFSETKRHHHGDEYIYYVDEKENIATGLILRLSNVKSGITTKTDADGNLVVDITTLNDDQTSTEATIFCVNPETGRGLAYSYRRSSTTSLLRTIFKEAHSAVRTSKIKDLTKQYSKLDSTKSGTASKKANEDVKGNFTIKLLSTPATIQTILESYDAIDSISIGAEEALENSGVYSPESPYVSKAKLAISFTNIHSNLLLIKKYINKITKNRTKEDAIRIHGQLEDGVQKWFTVGDNISEFGVLEFDRYIELLPDSLWKEYVDCPALTNLMSKIDSNSSVFGDIPINTDWRLPSAKNLPNIIKNVIKKAS
jgi:hypothetical protein